MQTNQEPLRRWIQRKSNELGGQAAFARSAGLAQPTISKFLNGTRPMGEEALAAIGETYPEALPMVQLASKIPFTHTQGVPAYVAKLTESLPTIDQLFVLRFIMGLKHTSLRDVIATSEWSVEEQDEMLRLARLLPEHVNNALAGIEETQHDLFSLAEYHLDEPAEYEERHDQTMVTA